MHDAVSTICHFLFIMYSLPCPLISLYCLLKTITVKSFLRRFDEYDNRKRLIRACKNKYFKLWFAMEKLRWCFQKQMFINVGKQKWIYRTCVPRKSKYHLLQAYILWDSQRISCFKIFKSIDTLIVINEVIQVVNFIKSWPPKCQICAIQWIQTTKHLYYIEVRWISKENILKRLKHLKTIHTSESRYEFVFSRWETTFEFSLLDQIWRLKV